MAAVGRSVQFRGIENVIIAYESNDVAPWALFQGSQLLAKSEGTDMEGGKELLSALLNRLNNEDNVATYTLCVYDDLKPGEKIKNNTKYDGSFNFKLNDTMNDYKAQNKSGIGAAMERIAALEQKLLEKNHESIENEPEEKTAWGHIGKLIEHPDVQKAIASKFVSILDGLTNFLSGKVPTFVSPSNIAQIGAVTPQPLAPDQVAKLNTALQYLSAADPLLGDHLLAIGIVAKHDVNKYNQLIGMINLL
jgi:hypothetical protein